MVRETDKQTYREQYEGNQRKKITSTSISQRASVRLRNTELHIHIHTIKTHTHRHTRTHSRHFQNPLWQNLPSVHNLISDPCLSILCTDGWGKRAAALAPSAVLSVHIARFLRTSLPISLLSPDAYEIEKKRKACSHFAQELLSSSSLSFCLQCTKPHSHPLFSED